MYNSSLIWNDFLELLLLAQNVSLLIFNLRSILKTFAYNYFEWYVGNYLLFLEKY